MDTINNNQENNKIKLDYTLTTPEERTRYIEEIIKQGASVSPHWLEIYSNYILEAQSKEDKHKREIFTENRLKTIGKREVSYEGLALKFENGEDGLHNILKPNDKNVLLTPKDKITDKDIEEVPGLRSLKQAIEEVLNNLKTATGRKKFYLKKQLIELYQDQYILKEAHRKPIHATRSTPSFYIPILDENIKVINNTDVESSGSISFFKVEHVAALLRTFSILKEQNQDQINSDLYYLLQEFESLIERTFKQDYPELFAIVQMKFAGCDSSHIQASLQSEYSLSFTLEYISKSWCNKIPALIVEKAKDEYLEWYYTFREYGKWKTCSCCGEVKLASTRFFSKNAAARDGLYSVCKKCRSTKYSLGKKV